MRRLLPLLAVLPFAAACAPMTEPASTAPAVRAVLRDAAGAEKGSATVTESSGRITVSVNASGLMPGAKGMHLHDVGRCEGPKFISAGPHWNPAMKQHGRDNPMGAHMGDAPNIEIGADGTGRATFTVEGSAAQLTAGGGKSIIIHAAPDDYRTDPTGNSGDRILCGVFAAGS